MCCDVTICCRRQSKWLRLEGSHPLERLLLNPGFILWDTVTPSFVPRVCFTHWSYLRSRLSFVDEPTQLLPLSSTHTVPVGNPNLLSLRRIAISGGIRPQLLSGSFSGQSLKPVDVAGAFASLFVVLGSNPQIARNSRIHIVFFLFSNFTLIFFHPFSSSVSVLLRFKCCGCEWLDSHSKGVWGGREKRGGTALVFSGISRRSSPDLHVNGCWSCF